MAKKAFWHNRGDGVLINLNAPLRVRDKQMGKKAKKK